MGASVILLVAGEKRIWLDRNGANRRMEPGSDLAFGIYRAGQTRYMWAGSHTDPSKMNRCKTGGMNLGAIRRKLAWQ